MRIVAAELLMRWLNCDSSYVGMPTDHLLSR